MADWLNATRAEAAVQTTARRLASARAYARWAGMSKLLDDYRLPTAQRSVPHPLPEGIDGVERMCNAASTYTHSALFALLGLCGLRVSEARSVDPTHFDLDRMTLTVRGKGDKQRTIPISSKAWMHLQGAFVEAFQSGNRPLVNISDTTAREAVREMGRRLEFRRPIASHDLRATCATALHNKTKDIRMVQEFLGHASVTTTEIYVQVTMDSMREGLSF